MNFTTTTKSCYRCDALFEIVLYPVMQMTLKVFGLKKMYKFTIYIHTTLVVVLVVYFECICHNRMQRVCVCCGFKRGFILAQVSIPQRLFVVRTCVVHDPDVIRLLWKLYHVIYRAEMHAQHPCIKVFRSEVYRNIIYMVEKLLFPRK